MGTNYLYYKRSDNKTAGYTYTLLSLFPNVDETYHVSSRVSPSVAEIHRERGRES